MPELPSSHSRLGTSFAAMIPFWSECTNISCMGDLGRVLVFLGGVVLVIGLIFILAGKFNLPVGRLPGDIVYRGKNTTFYFPLMTSIVLSLVLSLVLYFVNRMR